MAGEEAEVKKVAKLTFDIQSATTKLDEINKKLDQIANSSEAYAKRIGTNLNSAINVNGMINTKGVEQKFQTITGYTTKFGNKLKYTLNGKIDFSKLIDVNKFKNEFNQLEKLGVASIKKITTTTLNEGAKTAANRKRQLDKVNAAEKIANASILTSEAKTSDKIKVIAAETASYKEKRIADAALAQEKANLRQLKSTKTMYDKIADYAKTYVVYQAFNKLKQAVSETIDEMVDLEYQMVQIERVMNVAGLNIDNFRDKLIQMAYDYGAAFEDVSDISLRLAQAGFKEQENLALTEKTLLALNTAELDATQATEDMIAVMSQWGLITGDATKEAENYGNIIDKINKVADNYPTTSADILEALKKTSSAFNLAGASIDETIAAITAAEIASQRGGKQIGTALSNIVQQLKAEGKLNLAESMGLEFFEDAEKTTFKPIMDIIGEMAERMQSLKDAGKENSVEMQNLLEMFTVFRRNIGASLLGEMAGEESNYAKILETSLNSVGYSLQENEKHMGTAKAAQAQFNAELLKLKTNVWDKGVEDVFRGLLNLGKDITGGINGLIETFGIIPTIMATVTIAFTTLNKNFKNFKYNAETGKMELSGFIKKIKEATEQVRHTNKGILTLANNQGVMITNTKYSASIWAKNTWAVTKYAGALALTTLKTIAFRAVTIALNAAISLGLTAAITAITAAIDAWTNKNENLIASINNDIDKTKEQISSLEEEEKALKSLTEEYEEYIKKSKDGFSEEDYQKIYELQENINQSLKGSGEQIELIKQETNEYGDLVWKVNEAYDAQLSKLKSIDYEKQKETITQKQELVNQYETQAQVNKVTMGEGGNFSPWKSQGLLQGLADINEVSENVANNWGEAVRNLSSFVDELNNKSLEDRVDKLKEMKDALSEYINTQEYDQQTQEAYSWITDEYNKQKELLDGLTAANEDYKKSISELYSSKGYMDAYNSNLHSILREYDSQSANQIANDILSINKQFKEGKLTSEEYFTKLKPLVDDIKVKIK